MASWMIAALFGITAAASASAAPPHAAGTFNPLEYGAVGDGQSHVLGTAYGTTPAAVAAWTRPDGSKPFAWMTDPRAGLVFTLTTSAAQDRTGPQLGFKRHLSGINDWQADVSQFNADPANGQKLLAPGWLVTSTDGCLPSGNVVTGVDAETGMVTLRQPTLRPCPANATVTFTVPPRILQGLEMDYLGTQGAMFAASNARGGVVQLPPGDYRWNHSVWNPGIRSGREFQGNADLVGSGRAATRISFVTDLGPGACALGDVDRGQGSVGYAHYGDFRLIGPGRPNTTGHPVAGMDGLCIGAKAIVEQLVVGAFHAGISVLNDHGTIHNVDVGNNFYGVYFAPNSDVIGNWNISESGLGGEAWAGVGVAWNNQIDFARLTALDIGTSSPYAIYREPTPRDQPRSLGFLSNSVLDHLFAEQVGNGFIYGENPGDGVDGNVFLHVVPWLNPTQDFRIPGRGVAGVIVAGRVFHNEFIATELSNSGAHDRLVETAIVVARNNIQANHWGDVTGAVVDHMEGKPYLSAPTMLFNDFVTDRSRGRFLAAEMPVAGGQVVAIGKVPYGGSVRPFQAGLFPAGVAQRSAAAGQVTPVVMEGLATVSKSTTAPISAGAAVIVSPASPGTVTGAAAGAAAGGSTIGVLAEPGDLAPGSVSAQVLLRLPGQ